MTSRWLCRDPIEEQGGINLYAFVGNDGVNEWDILGQQRGRRGPQYKSPLCTIYSRLKKGLCKWKCQCPHGYTHQDGVVFFLTRCCSKPPSNDLKNCYKKGKPKKKSPPRKKSWRFRSPLLFPPLELLDPTAPYRQPRFS